MTTMTEEEIEEVRKRKAKERNKAYYQTEEYRHKANERSKARWRRIKARMEIDPEYRQQMRQMFNERYQRNYGKHGTQIGRPSTMTDKQKATINTLYLDRHYKVARISRYVNEPYGKVWQYIRNHITTTA